MPVSNTVSKKAMVAALRAQLELERNERLLARYNNNPILWIEEKAKGYMWSIPRKIAQSVVDHQRTAVKACHGVGKSWLTARLATWWIDTI